MEVNYCHPDIAEFLETLEKPIKARVDRTIELLVTRKYQLVMPYSKKLEKDLYELRIQGTQNIRVFYTFYKDKIVLLHAMTKKSQKLNQRNLETARRRLARLHLI